MSPWCHEGGLERIKRDDEFRDWFCAVRAFRDCQRPVNTKRLQRLVDLLLYEEGVTVATTQPESIACTILPKKKTPNKSDTTQRIRPIRAKKNAPIRNDSFLPLVEKHTNTAFSHRSRDEGIVLFALGDDRWPVVERLERLPSEWRVPSTWGAERVGF